VVINQADGANTFIVIDDRQAGAQWLRSRGAKSLQSYFLRKLCAMRLKTAKYFSCASRDAKPCMRK
jgi:hypothetical protein